MPNVDELINHSDLISSARKNIREFLACGTLPSWARNSAIELLEMGAYSELNGRFFQTLRFGTGGIRGRMIGGAIPPSERGSAESSAPEHASVGTAYINDFSIIRATVALFKYCKKYLDNSDRSDEVPPLIDEAPSLIVAHDTRFFSRHFCKLCASIWVRLGGHAAIFDGPRSTPELSFSVRYFRAMAGVMITASHNPWHDNGFKAYFSDGAQMVDPHASEVIGEYEALTTDYVAKCLSMAADKELSGVKILDGSVDSAYVDSIWRNVPIEPHYESSSLSVVFTPLHGVGAISSVPLLDRYAWGLKNYHVVGKQNDRDPMFSTVKSPNPENREALKLAVDKAREIGADIVLATDPDGDRVALAAKNKGGEFEYFSGNVTWSMLLEYRLSALFKRGILTPENRNNAAVIKTFVTTPLIEKIAKHYGIRCVNTLTGFKWIGEKIADYEKILNDKLPQTDMRFSRRRRDAMDGRMELFLQHSTFFLFGCEESYGCLATDIVRDKDANAAVLMLCEMSEYAKIHGLTPCDLRDEMFKKYGYFGESVLNIYYDGADGVEKIANILASYRLEKPAAVNGVRVTKFVDFLVDDIFDADGKKISKENFFFIELENGSKCAVRASGTEPKIKFYMFCEGEASQNLDSEKRRVEGVLNAMKSHLERDAHGRAKFRA
ncbi:MAG: phospho-sugar mutase [Puniceicoccales bacterium]|jgi:phosphoglucomutase|nr:phospho-sugar mutase [Puniceicoccales bacterium]